MRLISFSICTLVAVAVLSPAMLFAVPDDYALVFSDEFSGDALDSNKWHADYAPGVHPDGTNGEKTDIHIHEHLHSRRQALPNSSPERG